ncbi:ovostatin-like [Eleutherodactylus coqui]|uniref:ovostatin-like n=1 Tax=Eleutherodactylus coqui TaxID=57060 RepID=UPI003462968D
MDALSALDKDQTACVEVTRATAGARRRSAGRRCGAYNPVETKGLQQSVDMYLKRLILSLALLCLPTGATSQPQCAFLIPALLKSGEMASGCLEVKRHLEPVNVVINLEVNGVNYTVFSEEVPAENKLMCPEFQVPDVSEAVPGFLTIYAVATNFVYNEPRTLMVAPTGKATLIQLERTIYKPGQTVRCSVIATDNNLYMTDDVVSIVYAPVLCYAPLHPQDLKSQFK